MNEQRALLHHALSILCILPFLTSLASTGSLATNHLVSTRFFCRRLLFPGPSDEFLALGPRKPDLGQEILVTVTMKNQTFVISELVGFDRHGKVRVFNIAVFAAELQALASKQSRPLNDVFASLKFLTPDYKIERDSCLDLRLLLRLAWYSRESEKHSAKSS
jgi:hypothetical protein